MTVFDWMGRTLSYVRSKGLRTGLNKSAGEFKHGLANRIDARLSGRAVFESQWDVLIILDACRPDLLAEASDDYDFLPSSPDTIRSKGSGSRSWMERNFTDDWATEMADTAYVSGNPFTDELVTDGQFGYLDEVWRYSWDDEVGTVPARPITDRAIDTARTTEFDRLLVHYMQPHFPSIPDPVGSGIDIETFGEGWDSIWDDLAAGRVSTDRAWESYRANLDYVLEEVSLLLDNIDADTAVISADHGNAFGEFGFYGHPPYNPIPALRTVPWVETTATDSGSYEPTTERQNRRVTDDEVTSRLADLGYR